MELLAPAGNAAALYAAVQSGADAVYIGGEYFSARHSAENFTTEAIAETVKYCHLRGVKVYAAVNTLVKDREFEFLCAYMYKLNDAGIDGVIIQDMGVFHVIRHIVPELPIHASTQMTVHNLAGAEYLHGIGFKRVIVARELSKKNIEYICANTDCEIEMFVHGAICICYSGQCLMSSIIGGRSGNRGRCAQPCRLEYELLKDGRTVKTGSLLSPKDMALFDKIGEIKKMGVESLKIEGRLKRAEYVVLTTKIYRNCIQTGKSDKGDLEALMSAFNRSGFTKAYYTGTINEKMMSYKDPSNMGERIFEKDIRAYCREEARFRLVRINIKAELKKDKPFSVTFEDPDGRRVTAVGDIIPEPALNREIDADRIKEQLMKLGTSVYFPVDVSVDADPGLSISISEINSVRRRAADMLTAARTETAPRKKVRQEYREYTDRSGIDCMEITVEVNNKEQLEAAFNHNIGKIYVPHELYRYASGHSPDDTLLIVKPPVILHDDMADFEMPKGADAVMINYPYQAEKYKDYDCYGNYRLNIMNNYAADFYKDKLKRITLSPEMNLKEIERFLAKSDDDVELIAYGRLTL
ncbi:MAG: U32 family peptidase, partial [Oscillospiraceae bacterium]|nr:U32 family peptidase [Oscillospiraceae bacterium]